MKQNKVKQNCKQINKSSDRAEPENLSHEYFEIQCKASGLRK